ncbi:YARHG domain-containing protein [Treponema bryantii]|uniref:YARHG domain-containing protein n=1 Tax=Treponema bryantii TaxID=163 RepID=A0A1H9BDA5_9SPIR|nr:YARHG domain-containing protein [Treponema bryantii]SEP86976.1 YARHG domain-containing protein [Treponema bryantii]
MKKYLLCIFALLQIISFSYTQNIEKLGEIETLTSYQRMNTIIPSDTYVDEINNYLYCRSDRGESQSIYNLNKISEEPKKKNYFAKTTTETFIILNNYEIHFSEMAFEIKKENEIIVNGPLSCGISFILKKGSGYIVYYVDTNGCPGAVDTTGRIYSSEEAMAYLKEYDPEKYMQSEKRAAELELYNDFIRNQVLIWGKRYYSTSGKMKKVLGKSGLILNGLIQYDMQGNAYQIDFDWWGNYKNDWGIRFDEGTEDNSNFVCADVNGNRIVLLTDLNNYSKILGSKGDYQETRPEYSTSWYVGFGGNIYYYIAGEEYTEVFRIRRTWGEPDFYAMAINGYTEDDYGKYVNEVLPKLSKADLRLLRNTIFALYGVHFKSADLSKYFDKQVWYTDEGKTSADVTLPEHRQKLVEMIQKLEK